MAIRVAIKHWTEYRFDRLIALAPHVVRLRPANHTRTPIISYALKTSPAEHFVNWQQDPFGNHMARFVFPERARRLSFEVDLVAELTVINPFDFFVEEAFEHFPFAYDEQLANDLAPYLEVRESGPRLRDWLAGVDHAPQRVVDFLVALNQRVQRDVGYVVRMEAGVQTCEQTLHSARGSCRDSAWLLVQIMRHLGVAARFVSGYLIQLAADVESLDGPSGPREDFTDLHAWAEVYVPGAGWLGLDATSGLFAGEGHIPLACTPDPASAAPVTGATDPCEVTFAYRNEVQRIHEDPRVTSPYDDAQWAAIDALGQAVDARLAAGDVRLTMGGEPTFVSIDDMDGAQWNIAALGDEKRALSAALLERLESRFATGALRHYGQGKWYPGEPLPRWALGCYWRADGEPLWSRADLMAGEAGARECTIEDAERFVRVLTARLGVGGEHIVPAFEDVLYYLWRESNLPEDVDPLDTDLDDPLERRRLAALLARGLGEVTGFALPLEASDGDEAPTRWRTSEWRFRRGRMFLLPGDSAMGYRLPLDSLVEGDPEAREFRPQRDPFEPRPPLAAPLWFGERPGASSAETPAAEAERPGEPGAEDLVRTALCVSPGSGCLNLFLPPLTHLEHAVALLGAIEAAAIEVARPVRFEGYPLPRDGRLRQFQITPDPGVIEVNVQPASSWAELREITETLYDEARSTRLGTEKFMLDGRHGGTGGGNHVTIGGRTPADSPVLRRPHLLRSLVAYWQHHPGLSYLFSGAFVGPTSQAPRVDEGRDESLYELEIAFQQLDRGATPASPWVVDRALRNLLTDLTGNTHRAEFCIDKLYSPDGPGGRQGLVEFRAFEMPPHPRMSLVQMLLLRALVARFWDAPFRARPIRWGTALHDRFMLPHFVQADLERVLEDLADAGHAFDRRWFAPFLEFRFPHYGTVEVDGVSLSLNWAIEPWHVLGEEVTLQGTSRFVDSAVERLQVKVRGLMPERLAITCNGRPVPLHPTHTRGEFVAGVRYKAWQPPSGLHPAIRAHGPLVFDVVDLVNRRAIGGCTYHVAHPGGRNYETFPVNANEAEARRIARFWPHGHTPGTIDPPPEERNPAYPCTLDLRFDAR